MSDEQNPDPVLSFLAAKFDRIEQRFDILQDEVRQGYDTLSERMGRIEAAVRSSRHEVLLFDEAVSIKQDQIDVLSHRISHLERTLGTSYPPATTPSAGE